MKNKSRDKVKKLLNAICKQKKQRFYKVELAKTEIGVLKMTYDATKDTLYLSFADKRIKADRTIGIFCDMFLAITK